MWETIKGNNIVVYNFENKIFFINIFFKNYNIYFFITYKEENKIIYSINST